MTKEAEETLDETLKSVTFTDEILVIDQYSQDRTVDIALRYTTNIHSTSNVSFAKRRNLAIQKCQTDWLLYIDSDEVVTIELASEIGTVIKNNQPGVYALVRDNYFLGKLMYPDSVERLFHLEVLRGWQGEVHESPIITMTPVSLANHLTHNTHRDISSMLNKTNEWSEIEADLLIKANHPKIAWWRLLRIAMTEKWHQFVQLKVGRFKREGVFEGVFQIIDKLIVYTKVWERQQPSEE